MKITIVTTPIRPTATSFPPIGSLSVIKYLKRHGFSDVDFYNIDANRPKYEDVLKHIETVSPDVLGISAVVSTAYAYTKQLADDVRRLLPDTLIVVGGNMAASAEVLLKKTGTDICVTGEGEVTFKNIVEKACVTRNLNEFHDVKGIVYLNDKGELVNTGYEEALQGEEIWDFDWEDLAASTDINHFFPPAFDEKGHPHAWFRHDPRSYEPHRAGKTVGSLKCAKGCVARCTFCHRWDKGIRSIPVDEVMERLEEMMEKFNVGFFLANAETFGADKRWLAEFCERIKKYDVLWQAPGVRANSLSPEWIAKMKDAGCVRVAYGNETGSAAMLEIMEKKVSLDDNYNSMKWAVEAGVQAPIQLVIGMPGENNQTIHETIEFCKFATSVSPYQNPNELSVNYAQALPGTPLYEFARHAGKIGQDLDGEEAYLLAISDRDAHDEYTTLNFTDLPTLICRTWRPRITIEVCQNFVQKYGIDQYYHVVMSDKRLSFGSGSDSGYFANPARLLEQEAFDRSRVPGLWSLVAGGKFGLAIVYHPTFFYRIKMILPLLLLVKETRDAGLKSSLRLALEYLKFHVSGKSVWCKFNFDYKSLRKIVDNDLGSLPGDAREMLALRKGR